MPGIPKELMQKLTHIRDRTDTDKGVTEEEAANNAAILSRLLAKHNLSVEDLSVIGSEGRVTDELVAEDSEEDWRKYLMYHLSKQNLCEVIWYANNGFLIVGQPENISVVRELYEWFTQLFPELAYEAWDEARQKPIIEAESDEFSFSRYLRIARQLDGKWETFERANADPMKWRSDFIHGMIDGLSYKIEREKRKDDDAKTNALVPLLEAEVMDYINDKYEDVEKVNIQNKSDPRSYRSGREAGENISTERQIYAADEPAGELN